MYEPLYTTFDNIVSKFFPLKKSVNKVKELDKMTNKKRKVNKVNDDDEDNDIPSAKKPKHEELTPAPTARQSVIVTADQNSSLAENKISIDNNADNNYNNNLLDFVYPPEESPTQTLEDKLDDIHKAKKLKHEELTPAPTARQSVIVTADQNSSLAENIIPIDNNADNNNNNLLDFLYPPEASPKHTLEDTVMETQQTGKHNIELVDEIGIDATTEKNVVDDMIEKTKQSKRKQIKNVSFENVETRSKTKASETVENLPYSLSSFTSIPDNVENPIHSSSSSKKNLSTSKTMVLRERLVIKMKLSYYI